MWTLHCGFPVFGFQMGLQTSTSVHSFHKWQSKSSHQNSIIGKRNTHTLSSSLIAVPSFWASTLPLWASSLPVLASTLPVLARVGPCWPLSCLCWPLPCALSMLASTLCPGHVGLYPVPWPCWPPPCALAVPICRAEGSPACLHSVCPALTCLNQALPG